MTAYLLTAAGVIFLTVIVSFIIPDGKLNKSVNFILRLVCIGVLLQPVTQVFDFTKTTQKELADYEYICNVYSQTQSEQLENELHSNLEIDCECTVAVTFEDGKISENGVTVFIEDCDDEKVEKIYEYLQGLGYINITVNEKSS